MEKKIKIYESPDGGKTVYERPFGSDNSQKKLLQKDVLFIDESIITNTPNDIELGAKVRKLYWDSKQK